MRKACKIVLSDIVRLLRLPRFPFEWLLSVDHFPIWRLHLIYSHSDGKNLRDILIQRFSSNMVILSLFLSIEVATLFSPSDAATDVRHALRDEDYSSVKFAIGIIIIFDIIITLTAILAAFTAWAMVSAIGDKNVHYIVRSSVGLYATQLPSRMLVAATYLFFTWINVWVYDLVTSMTIWSNLVVAFSIIGVVHVVSTYSALGRVIIHTHAMNDEPVFKRTGLSISGNCDGNNSEADPILPFEITHALLEVATETKLKDLPPQLAYYPNNYQPSTFIRRK